MQRLLDHDVEPACELLASCSSFYDLMNLCHISRDARRLFRPFHLQCAMLRWPIDEPRARYMFFFEKEKTSASASSVTRMYPHIHSVFVHVGPFWSYFYKLKLSEVVHEVRALCPRLRHLLVGYKFDHEGPRQFISPLSCFNAANINPALCEGLTSITFSWTTVCDLRVFSAFQSLRELRLIRCNVVSSTELDDLGHLTQLERLALTNMRVPSVAFASRMPRLQILCLISSIVCLWDADCGPPPPPRLVHLDVRRAVITPQPGTQQRRVSFPRSLTHLWISRIPKAPSPGDLPEVAGAISVDNASTLSSLDRLQTLVCSSRSIKGAMLAARRPSRPIGRSDDPFASIVPRSCWASLRYLDLSDHRVDITGIDECVNLESLRVYLGYKAVQKRQSVLLRGLVNLHSLSVNDVAPVDYIDALPRLRLLEIIAERNSWSPEAHAYVFHQYGSQPNTSPPPPPPADLLRLRQLLHLTIGTSWSGHREVRREWFTFITRECTQLQTLCIDGRSDYHTYSLGVLYAADLSALQRLERLLVPSYSFAETAAVFLSLRRLRELNLRHWPVCDLLPLVAGSGLPFLRRLHIDGRIDCIPLKAHPRFHDALPSLSELIHRSDNCLVPMVHRYHTAPGRCRGKSYYFLHVDELPPPQLIWEAWSGPGSWGEEEGV